MSLPYGSVTDYIRRAESEMAEGMEERAVVWAMLAQAQALIGLQGTIAQLIDFTTKIDPQTGMSTMGPAIRTRPS